MLAGGSTRADETFGRVAGGGGGDGFGNGRGYFARIDLGRFDRPGNRRGDLGGRSAGGLIRIAKLGVDRAESYMIKFIEPKFGAGGCKRRAGPWGDEANVGGKWS